VTHLIQNTKDKDYLRSIPWKEFSERLGLSEVPEIVHF
jgi:hypothetical protein